MVPHCGFNLHFPNNDAEHLSLYLSSLVKCLLKSFVYLKYWVAYFLVLNFKSSLCFFQYRSFVRYVICKYFSQSVACFLILFIVSSVDKDFIFMKSNLQFFSLRLMLLVLHVRNLCLTQSSQRFCFSRNLMVLNFTFGSIIHFLLILYQVKVLDWVFAYGF